jgi:beta-galactosidase
MGVTSKIAPYGGVPTLFVNGEPQVGMAYITYFQENNRYEDFAKAGYNLFTFATFFAGQTINETSQIKPFSPGIFDVKGQEDYTDFDRSVEQILKACPNAMIFPRVNMSLPAWWEDENPDELNDTGYGGNRRRACFSSKLWRRQSEEFLLKLIDHVEASSWCDHIVGYQIASGNTEEWFSFDQKGSIGKASRERFLEWGGDVSDEVGYRQFLSDIVADGIAYLAGVVKARTHRRLAVGSFYGYTFETPFWQSNHMGLRRLLNCGDVDFLCSPASYMRVRAPGRDWPCMTVLDSLKLHGKAYFVELDTRTHLSKFPKDSREGSTVPGTYEQPIWLGPESPEVCRWILRANISRQLTHGYNSWWFDMWGGWYASPELMVELRDLREIGASVLHGTDRRSIAEVAVFIDETCYSHLPDGRALGYRIAAANRDQLGVCGVPYDIYEISDFEAVQSNYLACVMLIPAMTTDMERALDRCKQADLPVLVVSQENPDLTTNALREFYADCGVWNWCDTDDVIYASNDLVAIHAATAGKKLIRLPQLQEIVPLLPAGESFTDDVIEVELEQYETRLFALKS